MKRSLYEMVVDDKEMIITVGEKVFREPYLYRMPENYFHLKADICGSLPKDQSLKAWHKHYTELLGPRFNYRFFAANYWLWMGNRVTQRTSNMLKREGHHWKMYDKDLVKLLTPALPYIKDAEKDNLYNIIPIILLFGQSPQNIEDSIGYEAWQRIAGNSVSRNLLILHAVLRCSDNDQNRLVALKKLLDVPSGVMHGIRNHIDDATLIAARITPLKNKEVFLKTLTLVRAVKNTFHSTKFDPNWNYEQFQKEHKEALNVEAWLRIINGQHP